MGTKKKMLQATAGNAGGGIAKYYLTGDGDDGRLGECMWIDMRVLANQDHLTMETFPSSVLNINKLSDVVEKTISLPNELC